MLKIIMFCVLSVCLSACVKSPPNQVDNACSIFKQYPEWYKSAKRVERKWQVPVAVQLAIIHQESRFNAHARPQRTKLLWVIPWTRPSSALGYTQALTPTWEHYKDKNGRLWASRKSFSDAVDFIGWYAGDARKRAGIPSDDAYKLYLAYHEGVGGYQRKTYLAKPWLIKVARKVKRQSQIYQTQLSHCRGLSAGGWFF